MMNLKLFDAGDIDVSLELLILEGTNIRSTSG